MHDVIETFTCEQGSEEWLRLRMGIPTASEYATVLAKPQKGSTESKTRRTYLLKLAGDAPDHPRAKMAEYACLSLHKGNRYLSAHKTYAQTLTTGQY